MEQAAISRAMDKLKEEVKKIAQTPSQPQVEPRPSSSKDPTHAICGQGLTRRLSELLMLAVHHLMRS